MAFKTHYYAAIAPIRLWTVFPWIRTYDNGVEFTWLFLVLAKWFVDETDGGYDEKA